MAKKLKKQVKQIIDPNLEEVDEEHAFEIEYDEETNEAVLVHHYRRQWGDGFDSDVEHGWGIEQNSYCIQQLMGILELQKQKVLHSAMVAGLVVTKSTPDMKEGNPIKSYKDVETKEEK